MTKEDYVSHEQAVKLKECGFDWPCYAFYGVEPDGKPLLFVSPLASVRREEQKGRDKIAPTLAQAAKWLREVKGIKVYAVYEYLHEMWYYHCGTAFDNYYNSFGDYYTYEAALSAGIDAALAIMLKEV